MPTHLGTFLALYYKMDVIKNSLIGFACFGATALVGCAESSDEPVGDSLRSTYVVVSGGKWGCKTCGFTNSPHFGDLAVDAATYDGYGSLTLPRYSALIDPSGQSWDVTFDHGELFASDGTSKVSQYGLIGWTLRAKRASGEELDAEIYAFNWVLDWTDAGGALPTYGLAYLDPDTETLTNVCEGMTLDETSVVFLEGERYDTSDGSVIPNQDHIVSAACRGHAIAKMAMVKYVPYDGQTSPEEREATIRMFRADYCGDGTSYTADGTPLEFTDIGAHNTVEFDPDTMSDVLEAHWTSEGATCVAKPRLPLYQLQKQNANDNSFLPCHPPECDEFFDGNGQGVWTSLVP